MNSSHLRTWLVAFLLPVGVVGAMEPFRATEVQGLIGATFWDEDEMTFQQAGGGVVAESDLSRMPTLGGVWNGGLAEAGSGLGWEIGGLVSWVTDDANVASVNGVGVVAIDTSLVVIDLFLGLRLDALFDEDRLRVYASAGPALMFGLADDERSEILATGSRTIIIDDSESSFGVGGYARAGIEYRFGLFDSVGVQVRGVRSELDFDETLGEVEITGITTAITVSRSW